MPLVVSDDGVAFQLDAARVAYNSALLRIHLFKNSISPDRTTTLGAFTEADFSGYAPQTITSWSSVTVGSHVATTAPTPVVFSVGVGGVANNIYGYYVTDSTDSILYWSEVDPAAPVALNTLGQTYTVYLQDTNYSQYP